MKLLKPLLLTLSTLLATPLLAEEAAVAGDPGADRLKAALLEKMPNLPIKSVTQTPVAGVYEVVYGSQVAYLSQDARFMFDGDLVNLQSGENLTEIRRSEGRLATLSAIPEEKMLVFAPKDNEVKHTITVFTDVECGYCRKLHREIGELNQAGVKVRYLLYPRAGIGSSSYKTMVSAWCADDRQAALTRAKQGEAIEEKQCETPIQEHMALASQLGLRGTPMIVLESGEMIPGYKPAKALIADLEQSSAAAK